jgi:nitroimidazol reductase NimA-like FMN-containing flavoprotein (pyridoxamine 5'-phosphate oxidase superfamily)
MATFPLTPRTQVKRLPKRGVYDRPSVYKILDEGFVCHVGFVVEGQPYVIPTGYARVADTLYIHGSAASRMLRGAAQGASICVTVTLVDGLVLARSAFHHSMNYRSVVVIGTAEVVENEQDKMFALRAFTEHIVPSRWQDVRPPDTKELAATLVLRMPIIEASAKIRTGPPLDDDADYELSVWAGIVPLRLTSDSPIPDPKMRSGHEAPAYAMTYFRDRKE